MLAVFGLGLRATWRHALSLLHDPGLLFRSIVAMNVVMPVLAAIVSSLIGIYRPVEVALVALMVSPVVPIMPSRQSKAGCDRAYVYGLFTAQSILAVFLLPLSVWVAARYFGVEMRMATGTVAAIVLVTILLPLAAGIGARAWMPRLAERWAGRIFQVAFLLLLLALVPILGLRRSEILALVGNGSLLAMTLVCTAALITGHLLGGGDPDHRGTLALATAMRHPAFALAIVAANEGEVRQVFAAILLYFMLNMVLTTIYLVWFKRWRTSHPSSVGEQRTATTSNL
jgi:BASS family bile acid:Na+ symporter